MKSAATPYVRPLSQGTQSYTPDSSEFPVTQPMTKLTAKYQVSQNCIQLSYLTLIIFGEQASGEAQYTTDIPLLPDELAAAFVITTQVCMSFCENLCSNITVVMVVLPLLHRQMQRLFLWTRQQLKKFQAL